MDAGDRPAPAILVGVDGSEQARAAAAFAAMLAAPRGGRVLLGAVHDPQAAADPACEHVRGAGVPGARGLVHAAASPARGLHELAGREGAAAVAVGASHHYGVGRLKPDGVTEALLHGSACPVLVVGPAAPPTEVRTIGVAHAGDAEGRSALAAGAALAADLGAELRVLGVVDPGPAGPYGEDELREARRAEHERGLARLAKRAAAHVRATVGHPGQALLHAGEELDLLVLGSRGYGPPGTVLLGSVSRRVVAHAPCPVLVMPRPAAVPCAAVA